MLVRLSARRAGEKNGVIVQVWYDRPLKMGRCEVRVDGCGVPRRTQADKHRHHREGCHDVNITAETTIAPVNGDVMPAATSKATDDRRLDLMKTYCTFRYISRLRMSTRGEAG